MLDFIALTPTLSFIPLGARGERFGTYVDTYAQGKENQIPKLCHPRSLLFLSLNK